MNIWSHVSKYKLTLEYSEFPFVWQVRIVCTDFSSFQRVRFAHELSPIHHETVSVQPRCLFYTTKALAFYRFLSSFNVRVCSNRGELLRGNVFISLELLLLVVKYIFIVVIVIIIFLRRGWVQA